MEWDCGFLYPRIKDKKKCNGCGACIRVCPSINADKLAGTDEEGYPITYGGWHIDDTVRFSSSSGGVFTALAQSIFDRGGVVYGACFDESMTVIHAEATDEASLSVMKGSKYVQSDVKDVFRKIEKKINNNIPVLFTGTPCQCAGLYCFFGKNSDNLFTAEVVCHGVPSPVILKEYFSYLEEKHGEGSPIIGFSFRTKQRGWLQNGFQMGTVVQFASGKKVLFMPAYKDKFMVGFLCDVYLRPSCHNCKYKTITKCYSNVSLADFWGVKHISPELNSKKGTSMIMVHNKKGQELIESAGKFLELMKVPHDEVYKHNPMILESCPENPKSTEFTEMLERKSFSKAARAYLSVFTWFCHQVKRRLSK